MVVTVNPLALPVKPRNGDRRNYPVDQKVSRYMTVTRLTPEAMAAAGAAWSSAVAAAVTLCSGAFGRIPDMGTPKLSTSPTPTSTKLAGFARKKGTVRSLDPADPRNLSHPSHREQWLELARALGRLEAREEYAILHGHKERQTDGIAKTKARDPP
jgi:hypothetical protein